MPNGEWIFDHDTYELVHQLTGLIILENDEIVPILLTLKIIVEIISAYLAYKVARTNERAREVSRNQSCELKLKRF